MEFEKYEKLIRGEDKMTDKVAYDVLRKAEPNWAANPSLRKQMTHGELETMMQNYHAKMLGETYAPNFMGGFHIDFKEYRLGATEGKAILLLHPNDYKRVLNIEDEPI